MISSLLVLFAFINNMSTVTWLCAETNKIWSFRLWYSVLSPRFISTNLMFTLVMMHSSPSPLQLSASSCFCILLYDTGISHAIPHSTFTLFLPLFTLHILNTLFSLSFNSSSFSALPHPHIFNWPSPSTSRNNGVWAFPTLRLSVSYAVAFARNVCRRPDSPHDPSRAVTNCSQAPLHVSLSSCSAAPPSPCFFLPSFSLAEP